MISNEIKTQHQALDDLTHKAEPLLYKNPMDATLNSQLSQCRARHHALDTESQSTVKLLEERVMDHENYDQCYMDSVEWLQEAEQQMVPLDDLGGDREAVEERLAALEVRGRGNGLVHIYLYLLSSQERP